MSEPTAQKIDPISEMIQKVGIENIQVQNILESSPDLTRGKKDGTIKFHTSNQNVQALMNQAMGEKRTLVGLVLWIPADKL